MQNLHLSNYRESRKGGLSTHLPFIQLINRFVKNRTSAISLLVLLCCYFINFVPCQCSP